jgi:hypothetical protein
MGGEGPGSLAAVLHAIEAQRLTIRGLATETIREVEVRRDDELGRLDRAVAALYGEEAAPALAEEAAPAAAQPLPKLKRRRRAAVATSSVATDKRREAVSRYLSEQDQPVAQGQICHFLRISPSAARTALARLREEGKVSRTGVGSSTCYELVADSRQASSLAGASERGTLQGRLLATIQDRGWASLDELAQAMDAPREQVRRECGALIREEEARMDRRDGRPVYVSVGAA